MAAGIGEEKRVKRCILHFTLGRVVYRWRLKSFFTKKNGERIRE
jgi:hypothetical protein